MTLRDKFVVLPREGPLVERRCLHRRAVILGAFLGYEALHRWQITRGLLLIQNKLHLFLPARLLRFLA